MARVLRHRKQFISARLGEKEKTEIRRIAQSEQRTLSQVAALLISEALQARQAKQEQAA